MTLTKVSPGQRLRIPAESWNAVLDATATVQAERFRQTAESDAASLRGEILIRNDTGAARDRFDIVGIGSPLILPSDNLAAFHGRVALQGVAPDASRPGIYAVLQEPVAAGRCGRAITSGITPVRVQVNATTDAAAEVASGSAGSLASAASGSALILWKEAGTGLRQAVVRLLGPSGGSASGDHLEIPVVQALHGFQVGHVVTTDPATGRYVLADAATGHRSRALGVVSAVADNGRCTLVLAGRLSGFAPAFAGLVPWTTYYLRPDAPGWVTADPGLEHIPVFTTTATISEILVGSQATAYRPRTCRRVMQPFHGFTVGTVIAGNGSGLAFIKAIATPGTSFWAAPVGVVSAVIDSNTFEFVSHGIIALSGLIDYTPYFLSDSVAGQLTATPPPSALVIGFCMGRSNLFVDIQLALTTQAIGNPNRNGLLRIRGTGPAGDAVVIDAALVTAATRALRIREVDVCSGGVARKMLILASDPY